MFRTLSDFTAVWKDEATMTQQVMSALTDAPRSAISSATAEPAAGAVVRGTITPAEAE